MTKAHKKRLEMIEHDLSPKQCAVQLALNMRRYGSQDDFLRAIAKGTYRKTPYIRPFFTLAQQAEKRSPGTKQENVRDANWLSRNLRGEFQTLKLILVDANEMIKNKAETCRLKVALQLSKLETMISQDAFAQTARKAATWIERWTAATSDEKTECQQILTELIVHSGLDGVETITAGSPNSTLSHLPSLLREWADNSAMLLTELIACSAAVQTVQERYFDNRPILFKNIEAALEAAIQKVRDAIILFDEYQQGSAGPLTPGPHQEQVGSNLPIDIAAVEERAKLLGDTIADEWVATAKNKAKIDILEETHEHEDVVWQTFRKEMGLKY